MSVPTTARPGQAMSWEEYARLPEGPRYEYVDGHLVVNPSPSFRHQMISVNLLVALRGVLPGTHRAVPTWAWKPARDEFIPDVMVCAIADVEAGGPARFTGTPALVVEVLSGNRGDDLVRKATKYAAAGLPHYWIVDPRDEVVQTFALDAGTYRSDVTLVAGDPPAELDLGVARLVTSVAELLTP
ncbi:Uma2 family endonuclease [Paenibacillus sp. TRM 82003]|uniref:Uma2 family endonuclease n=1 Tax=Kineococcus sp. TRM81007 TaxID=2925831 RepID=UPI001F570B71|nr:Uma2 family endonuclease [Kineococcus sp. TRM81007]MCI2239003.1 Uma2 family endonuclease [Kineococcus sp. TRM81007]MCI3924423.1 Uma2 family endonuclease [Paenibacillus sp. TRM 82003]